MTLQNTLFAPSINTQVNPIALRPYQIEAGEAIREGWYTKGLRGVEIVMATGTGKTETFLSVLAEERAQGRFKKALIVAHRKELVEQPASRAIRNWSHALPHPGIVMAGRDDVASELICATVQTLQSPARLSRLLLHGEISHVVIDECHHAGAEGYTSLLDAIAEMYPNVKALGVTATPAAEPFPFDEIVYRVSIRKAVRELRCLVEPVGFAVHVPINLSSIKVRNGDFNESELSDAVESAHLEKIIYETWKERAADRPTMCFATSVALAERYYEYFTAKGVRAGFASGNTDKDVRSGIIERFNRGEIQVLFNCNVWTEGFDAPRISCVLMARPTLSNTFYKQAVGRGLRLFDGKSDCLIIDFAPGDCSRNLIGAGDVLERNPAQKRTLEKALEAGLITSVETLEQGELLDDEGDLPNTLVRVLDLLASKSKYKWTFDGLISSCSVDTERSICIVHPQKERVAAAESLRQTGNWTPAYEVLLNAVKSYQVCIVEKSGVVNVALKSDSYDPAHEFAEEFLAENGVFAKAKAGWRGNQPSEKLVLFATRLGVYEPGLSSGELSQRITHKLCATSLKSAGVTR